MNRSEWLAKRRNYIGASDAAAALGVSPWKSQRALYEEKVGNVEPEDISDVEAVYWGHTLEAPIRQRVGELLDTDVLYDGPHAIFVSESLPFMSATLDGYLVCTDQIQGLFDDPRPIVHTGGTLQIKTASAWKAGDYADEDWPLPYRVQTQHELAVTGYDWGILAVLIGGQRLELKPFVRNDRFISAMIKAEREFWDRVQNREPPEADGHASTVAVLNKLYPRDDGEVITLPDEALIWDAALIEAKAAIKTAEGIIDEYESKLKDAIGTATIGELPGGGGGYSWKLRRRKAYAVEEREFRVLRRVKAE